MSEKTVTTTFEKFCIRLQKHPRTIWVGYCRIPGIEWEFDTWREAHRECQLAMWSEEAVAAQIVKKTYLKKVTQIDESVEEVPPKKTEIWYDH